MLAYYLTTKASYKQLLISSRDYYRKGKYTEAVKRFKTILNTRYHPEIACYLGRCYLYGRGGLPANTKKALDLFNEAARYGYSVGYYCLAKHREMFYERDFMDIPNFLEDKTQFTDFIGVKTYMMSLFKKAADAGHIESCYKLGQAYTYAPHYQLNPLCKNLEWYKKAAGHGHVRAMYDLGWVFQNGKQFGMEKDYVLAAMWYKRSAEKEFVKGMISLSWCYSRGKGVKKDKKMAAYWLNKAKRYKKTFKDAVKRIKHGDIIINTRTKVPETILHICTCHSSIQCAVSTHSDKKGFIVNEFGTHTYERARHCFGSKECYTKISNVKAFAEKFKRNEWKFS